MAGQALHDFSLGGVPDNCIVFTHVQAGTEADVVIGVAPFDMVIEKFSVTPETDANSALTVALHNVHGPGGSLAASNSAVAFDTAATDDGVDQIGITGDMDAAGDITTVDGVIDITKNIVRKGDRLAAKFSSTSTGLTTPTIVVVARQYRGS